MEKFLLGCDWGTSTFRLRLLNITEDAVIGEVVSDTGIAAMHRSWQEHPGLDKATAKVQLFRQYLKKQIETLSKEYAVNLDNVTVVISGMASSSIGMEDVPYATMPFALNGSSAVLKHIGSEKEFLHEIILISGVSSEKDVMRGEETQLIGLLALLQQSGSKPETGVLIFPGTHSKHIYISKGQLINFQTFMTGELFNIMCNHSILKASVQSGDASNLHSANATAFKLGIKESQSSGILNSLFSVRTNDLFNKLNKTQNAFYLSGLLIGEELSSLLKNEVPLLLCSAGNLFPFYKLAIDELGLLQRTITMSSDLVDKAALKGQKLLFHHYILNQHNG